MKYPLGPRIIKISITVKSALITKFQLIMEAIFLFFFFINFIHQHSVAEMRYIVYILMYLKHIALYLKLKLGLNY